MESKPTNLADMESERVEQSANKEIDAGEQSQDTVMETEDKNPGEAVEEEALVGEHKDVGRPIVIEEGTSLASSEVSPTIEKGTDDDDPPKIDDEKIHDEQNSRLETSPHLSPSPLVALDPVEGLTEPTLKDAVEQNIGSSEVSSDILKNDTDSGTVEKAVAVVLGETTTTTPDTKLSEDKGSPVMNEEKSAEEHDMTSLGDHNELPVNPDIKLSEDEDSLHHNADTVMEQDKAAEEQDMLSSGDHNNFPSSPDTKLSEDKDSLHHHADTVMKQDKSAEEHESLSSGDLDNFPSNPDTELSKDKDSLHHHADTVMEQDEAAEEHDVVSLGDGNTFPVNPTTKLSEENESPHCHADKVIEQDKATKEDEIIPSEDHMDFPASPDTKVVEENNDGIKECESNNMNLADDGSGQVDTDQGTTIELDKGLEVPGSETVSKLDNKPSAPVLMDVEKEPELPAAENSTDSGKNPDVLAVETSENSDKGKSLLPATQNLSDDNEGMMTLGDEPMEDIITDVPESGLVADPSVAPTYSKDVNVEATTNAENKDRDADNESASVRREPDPPCVASSIIKSEVGVSGDMNNGVHKVNLAPPAFDGTTKRSFLLDDTSDGNESGSEEDQSAFMKELEHFFRERHMEFKPPKFYGEGLNCLKLWRAVTRLGGYDKVTGCKLWRQVGESFRPPKTCTTVSWTFRGFYEKALLEYERHKVSGGEIHIPLEPEPMAIDNQASGSGRARRDAAARAMQGWHSQRLNGNGEVSDPANKDKNLVVHQKREKQIGTSPGLLKRKRQSSAEHGAKNAVQVSRPMLDVTVVDVGPPADWVKINVQRTQDCFEVYALVPGLVREEVRVQSDPAGRLVISGEPENPLNPWGATPFKKVVSLPTRIDPHHTSAVVTLNGQLFVRVPLEQSD